MVASGNIQYYILLLIHPTVTRPQMTTWTRQAIGGDEAIFVTSYINQPLDIDDVQVKIKAITLVFVLSLLSPQFGVVSSNYLLLTDLGSIIRSGWDFPRHTQTMGISFRTKYVKSLPGLLQDLGVRNYGRLLNFIAQFFPRLCVACMDNLSLLQS